MAPLPRDRDGHWEPGTNTEGGSKRNHSNLSCWTCSGVWQLRLPRPCHGTPDQGSFLRPSGKENVNLLRVKCVLREGGISKSVSVGRHVNLYHMSSLERTTTVARIRNGCLPLSIFPVALTL